MAKPHPPELRYTVDKRPDGTYIIESNIGVLSDVNYGGIESAIEEALLGNSTLVLNLTKVVHVKDEFIARFTRQVIDYYSRESPDRNSSRKKTADYFRTHVKLVVGQKIPRGIESYKDVFEIVSASGVVF